VESDPVVPATLHEVVEAVGPEGGPIAVHLDDEDPGRGLEASLEDIRSRLVEFARAQEWVLPPRVYGLVTVSGAGRYEADEEY
jgi:hypothetical protein